MNLPDDDDATASRYRLRRLAAPALLLVIGPAVAAIEQPPSSLLYLGSYRIAIGVFVTLVGFVALWFALRGD